MSRTFSFLLRALATACVLASCGGGGSGGGGGGNPIVDPARVPDLGASEFRVTPAFGTPADGSTTVAIELRLISLLGHPIGGAAVELEITGYANAWQPLPATDLDGRTSTTLASRAGERKTIRARTASGGRPTTFAPLTAEFLLIPEDTFFVRATGSDASSGRSPREAWRTLGHALATVPPGATLHVGAGTYAGPLTIALDSRVTNPLLVSGDRSGVMTGDAGAVVIEAGAEPWALRLSGAHRVVLQGLSLVGAQRGLLVEDSSDVRVLACRPYENDVGLVVDGADDLIVQDCRISSNRLDGMRIGDARRARIENNLVYANLADGLVLLAQTSELVVRSNTFYRNAGVHLLEAEAGGSGEIEENILSEGAAGIELFDASAYDVHDNVQWRNANHSSSRQDPDGCLEVDPMFADPFGEDGILGGIGADDDDFRLLPESEVLDIGMHLARDVLLGSRESLATRTTRTDDVLDGSGDDLAATNLGFHTALPVPPFESLARGGARIVHAVPLDVHVHPYAWERESPGVALARSGPALDAEIVFLEQRVSPLDSPEEILAAQVHTGTRGRVVLRHWDGRRWSEPALAPFQDGIAPAELDDRRFDLEYEALSGRALFVLADDDGIPSYQVLERGGWSPVAQVATVAAGAGRVRLVELVTRRGSDELALVTLDDQRDLVVTLWDGTAWGTPRRLESDVVFTPGWRPFDAAFESLSGDLLVTWGFNTFIEETRWATLERASGLWRTGQHPSTDAIGAHVVLAADPASDRIAAAMGEGDFDNDVVVSVWNGSAWVDTAELTLAGPIANRLLEVAWLGETGIACVVFRRQGNTGSFNTALLQPTGWRIQPDVVLDGVARAAQVRLAGASDSSALLGAVLDLQGRLFGLRYDGQAFTLLNGGTPLATGFDPLAPGRPFDSAVRPPAPAGLEPR